jgi:UDP-N-acetyl-D-mannosaminuronic acid transferase (WecB/TagA/CpsF family)
MLASGGGRRPEDYRRGDSPPIVCTVAHAVVVLGIRLADLTVGQAVARGLQGGLVLAPSGPGLCDLIRDPEYREALLASDLNLTDSGFVLLARMMRGHGLAARTSGYRYLYELLHEPSLRTPRATYWVMPSRESMLRNLAWLNEQGQPVAEEDCYVAPMYPRRGAVDDAELLAILEERRPLHVFVCVGSGVQEKLGLYLKRRLTYTPGIHCVGAAIAFLSGDQARIPLWADRLALGWLVRCVRDPKVFVPRYLKAFKLAYLILRYDEKAPPLVAAPR